MADLANPFKGLVPYRPADKGKLFGRDRDLHLVQDRIFSDKTTLLFAASGVGKTSFLQAALIPALEKRTYKVILHREWAGGDPLEVVKKAACDVLEVNASGLSLAEFFRDHRPSRCILILDQFEEVFQNHAWKPEFESFLDELSDVVNDRDLQVRLVLSMREDFLGELSVFDNRVPDLFANYYRLKNPTHEGAKDIIDLTAKLSEVSVSDKGRGILVNDLRRQKRRGKEHLMPQVVPPSMQLVCRQLWNDQFSGNGKGEFLRNYEEKQAQKILDSYCRDTLQRLTEPQKDIVAQALDFLITRHGAKMAYDAQTLAGHMGVDLNALHEALNELAKDEARILRDFKHEGAQWYELYHDMYSPALSAWRGEYQAKLDAKRRRQEQLAREAEERAKKERARANLARKVFIGAGIVAVLIMIAGWFWLDSQRREEARNLAVQSEAARDADSRLVLAVQAAETYELPETLHALTSAVEAERTFWGHQGDVNSAEFSPDGARVVTASSDNTARVWEAGSGRLLQTLEGHHGTVRSAEFSPDGERVVTASDDNTARVWEAGSGRLLQTLEGHQELVLSAEFSPDGERVVTASNDKTARLYVLNFDDLLRIAKERLPANAPPGE